ncbi:MAG TPA: hypothetical protein QF753_17065 [Victivallales bacterium]|nr:hypothetical protein [Victivallales bacterium]
MEINRTFEIIGCLAEGVDPKTLQKLPNESVFNQPEVIRALNTAFNMLGTKLQKIKEEEKKRKKRPLKQGEKWLANEEEELKRNFESGKDVNDLAKAHHRSTLSIKKRLEKMGLITFQK